MTSISCVITAPSGIAECLLPDDVIVGADDRSAEIIVVDGSDTYADQSRLGVKHLWRPGGSIYDLMTVGLRQAKMEWVVIFEDHGRPRPAFLHAYRLAIANYPDMDLLGGALENASSTSPWSFATFLFGSHEYWPPAGCRPGLPTNANLAVRRSAVLDSELASGSGFMYRTVPRLVRANRYTYCPDAVVDHVVPLTWQGALAKQFHCSAGVTRGRREASASEPIRRQLARDCVEAAYHATVTPFRIMLHLVGTGQFRWSTMWRLLAMGASSGAGVLSAGIQRPRTRS